MNRTVTTDNMFLTLEGKRLMLKQIFGEKVLKIIFTKKDGSTRELIGTLKPDLIPEDKKTDNQLPLPFDKNDMKLIEKKIRKSNPNVFSVYDLEKEGWRSFIIDNLKDFHVVEHYDGKN